MTRCRPCESAPATGAAADGTGCISVTGAGTDADPFEIGLASGCLPLKVCTSATRPAGPDEGQMIFETDTGWTRIWNGSLWQLVKPTVSDSEQVQVLGSSNFGPGGGPYTFGTLTITEPWGSGDPFVALVLGSVTAASDTVGDAWDIWLESGGNTLDETRAVTEATGAGIFGRGHMGPGLVVSSDGSSQTVDMKATAYSAAGHIQPTADVRFCAIRAQVFSL